MPRIGPRSTSTEEHKECVFCGEEIDETDLISGWQSITQVLFAGMVGNLIQKEPGTKFFYHRVCHVPPRRAGSYAGAYCKLCDLPETMHDANKACLLQSPTGLWGSHPTNRFTSRR